MTEVSKLNENTDFLQMSNLGVQIHKIKQKHRKVLFQLHWTLMAGIEPALVCSRMLMYACPLYAHVVMKSDVLYL